MNWIKVFPFLFFILLTIYLTRTFWPRPAADNRSPHITISPIPREGPPPRIQISFTNTEILDLLEERRGIIGRLQNQITGLKEKLLTRQELPPDTVIVYQTVIPSSAIARGILHFKLSDELLSVDLADVTDSIAVLSSWKRDNVRNDIEVWALQEPDLPPVRWIRLDEKRNLFDLDLINLGYSTRSGLFMDLLPMRIGALRFKGRAIQDGFSGEAWIKIF